MRLTHRALLGALFAVVAALWAAAPASAHVVPSSVLTLDVHADDITADLTLPTADLRTASGLDVPTDGTLSAQTAADIASYVEEHFEVTSDSGAWVVTVDDVAATATEQYGTGEFPAVTATATLTPTGGADLREFTLDYDVIVHQVVTADVYVVLGSDWAAGQIDSARTLGAITVDTVTGSIPTLSVDLDGGSSWTGFLGMLELGVQHIAEGTDHQLFLLTLLLPAPLIASAGRWSAVSGRRATVRRITGITLAFTVGHSLTLALGTLGLPVPQRPVEALIAVSILVAAVHAVRPVFPGREAFVAGVFGLVHGMAFSTTLASLDLSGSQLALSLLGFNLGIELMQLLVVLVVLPPLVVLAGTGAYPLLRNGAALVTGLAAIGWLLARVGYPNALGRAADSLGGASPWLVVALWAAATAVLLSRRAGRPRGTPPPTGAPRGRTVASRDRAELRRP